LGKALGFPTREKTRVRAAVVAYGYRSAAQEDDVHCVRMTALHAERMMMVAAVRRSDGAGGHIDDLDPV
jgi:hypothetical protein